MTTNEQIHNEFYLVYQEIVGLIGLFKSFLDWPVNKA